MHLTSFVYVSEAGWQSRYRLLWIASIYYTIRQLVGIRVGGAILQQTYSIPQNEVCKKYTLRQWWFT